MKAVVAALNQEKALVGAFSVITNLRMELFEALVSTCHSTAAHLRQPDVSAPQRHDVAHEGRHVGDHRTAAGGRGLQPAAMQCSAAVPAPGTPEGVTPFI